MDISAPLSSPLKAWQWEAASGLCIPLLIPPNWKALLSRLCS